MSLRKDLADGHFDGNEHLDSGLKDVMKLVEKRIGLCMTLFLTIFYPDVCADHKEGPWTSSTVPRADPPGRSEQPDHVHVDRGPTRRVLASGNRGRPEPHVKMMPWALVFVVIYSLAFPLFIYCKFSKNKLKIFEDQLLMRAGPRRQGPKRTSTLRSAIGTRACTRNYKPQYWGLVDHRDLQEARRVFYGTHVPSQPVVPTRRRADGALYCIHAAKCSTNRS